MEHNWQVNEEAYDVDDGDEAYEGMDAYVDGTGAGAVLFSSSGRRGINDGDVDDDGDNFEQEDEEDDDIQDTEYDAENALEALQEVDSQSLHMNPQEPLDISVVDGSERLAVLERFLALVRTSMPGVNSFSVPLGTPSREDVEEDPQSRLSRGERMSRVNEWWKKPHREPQPAGVQLLMSGEFGRVGPKLRSRGVGNRSLAKLVKERVAGPGRIPKEDFCETLVPNSAGSVVASYPANVYCGQFSADSSFYYVCCKDFNLHIYDMTAPRMQGKHPSLLHYDSSSGHQTTMKVHKSVKGIPEGWTITDSHLSPDNQRMIYSAMNSTVYMTKTLEYDSTQVPINFSDSRNPRSRGHTWGWDDDSFCIWSCRFSADGNEVIAGGRGKIFVYDLLEERRTVKISAHEDDVNSCCWADSGSNVLISASDDTFLKVWDRRSLGSSTRPSGVLIGHTEGITNVSAKGDGRYVISNGKDQALRLWDLRMMRSNSEYEAVKDKFYGLNNFDYRYSDDRKQRKPAHPKDCSVMTYRGHTVMRTLIRCHFSPIESTGSSYIYSGSSDGRVHIWSLDGRVVQVLDRSKTLPISFDPSAPELADTHERRGGGFCVRDVAWHSREPVILSAAWHAQGSSTVARHEWKGLSKMGGRLEDWVGKRDAEAQEARRSRASERTPLRRSVTIIPGAYFNSDSDDDDDDGEYIPGNSD